jgi:hypothetical protein
MVVIQKKNAGRGRGKTGSKLSTPQPVNLLPETQTDDKTQSTMQPSQTTTSSTQGAWGNQTDHDTKTAWSNKPIVEPTIQQVSQDFPTLDASMFILCLTHIRTSTSKEETR